MNADRSFNINHAQIGQGEPVRLAGGIIGTWGNDRIFYTTYCGSSCLGFEVISLTTGQKQKGSLAFLFDDNSDEYTVFGDWNGIYHRFDGEFISVSGSEQGEKLTLDFTIRDRTASDPIIHSIEFGK